MAPLLFGLFVAWSSNIALSAQVLRLSVSPCSPLIIER
jgi:hypothetical protein